eukprot:8682320-Lingulodinium_polyedra.AAC.1
MSQHSVPIQHLMTTMPANVSVATHMTWSISVCTTVKIRPGAQTIGVKDTTTTRGAMSRGPRHGMGSSGSWMMLMRSRPLAPEQIRGCAAVDTGCTSSVAP